MNNTNERQNANRTNIEVTSERTKYSVTSCDITEHHYEIIQTKDKITCQVR